MDIAPDMHTWIVYTSGTTGQPKGLLQNHGNLAYYMKLYQELFRVTPADRQCTLFSLYVNGGLHDLLIGLTNGIPVYLWDAASLGVAGLASWLIAERVTIYSSVPTAFRQFAATLDPSQSFSDLRMIRLWGEPSYRRDFNALGRFFEPHCELVNRIGSSETGPYCLRRFTRDSVFEGNALPVGATTPGHEVRLVNAEDRVVRPGEAGEIVVRSRYLSPGYWRRDVETRKVFSSDESDPPMREFHTGDMGRMLTGGCLVALGRKDFQVKIRGYRVEPDEIELRLLQHPAVRDAIVIAREDGAGDARLVAYMVLRPNTARPTVTELRRLIDRELPQYMIPAAYVYLDAFPRAPNGKIARRELPEPGRLRPDLEAAYAEPSGEQERRLAGIWKEVLELDEIGIDDPFLDLGGNSILAAKLAARVLRDFQIEIPLKDVLASATVREMAETIAAAGGERMERWLREIESLTPEQAQELIDRDQGHMP